MTTYYAISSDTAESIATALKKYYSSQDINLNLISGADIPALISGITADRDWVSTILYNNTSQAPSQISLLVSDIYDARLSYITPNLFNRNSYIRSIDLPYAESITDTAIGKLPNLIHLDLPRLKFLASSAFNFAYYTNYAYNSAYSVYSTTDSVAYTYCPSLHFLELGSKLTDSEYISVELLYNFGLTLVRPAQFISCIILNNVKQNSGGLIEGNTYAFRYLKELILNNYAWSGSLRAASYFIGSTSCFQFGSNFTGHIYMLASDLSKLIQTNAYISTVINGAVNSAGTSINDLPFSSMNTWSSEPFRNKFYEFIALTDEEMAALIKKRRLEQKEYCASFGLEVMPDVVASSTDLL